MKIYKSGGLTVEEGLGQKLTLSEIQPNRFSIDLCTLPWLRMDRVSASPQTYSDIILDCTGSDMVKATIISHTGTITESSYITCPVNEPTSIPVGDTLIDVYNDGNGSDTTSGEIRLRPLVEFNNIFASVNILDGTNQGVDTYHCFWLFPDRQFNLRKISTVAGTQFTNQFSVSVQQELGTETIYDQFTPTIDATSWVTTYQPSPADTVTTSDLVAIWVKTSFDATADGIYLNDIVIEYQDDGDSVRYVHLTGAAYRATSANEGYNVYLSTTGAVVGGSSTFHVGDLPISQTITLPGSDETWRARVNRIDRYGFESMSSYNDLNIEATVTTIVNPPNPPTDLTLTEENGYIRVGAKFKQTTGSPMPTYFRITDGVDTVDVLVGQANQDGFYYLNAVVGPFGFDMDYTISVSMLTEDDVESEIVSTNITMTTGVYRLIRPGIVATSQSSSNALKFNSDIYIDDTLYYLPEDGAAFLIFAVDFDSHIFYLTNARYHADFVGWTLKCEDISGPQVITDYPYCETDSNGLYWMCVNGERKVQFDVVNKVISATRFSNWTNNCPENEIIVPTDHGLYFQSFDDRLKRWRTIMSVDENGTLYFGIPVKEV